VYRVVVLGSSTVGKTAIISQFLYDSFTSGYKETVDEMYHGEFDVGGCELTLNIQDTGGSYVDEFPAMIGVSLASADAVLLVFSVAALHSFEEVSRMRDLVQGIKGKDIPIVVVGNKTDLPREISKEEAEATVMFDWENGYMECCAKDNINISLVFKELLNQAKSRFDFSNPVGRVQGSSPSTPLSMQRRQSLPQVPVFDRLVTDEGGRSPSPGSSRKKSLPNKKSSSVAVTRRESCKVQ
jgi:small GTP-binding protein